MTTKNIPFRIPNPAESFNTVNFVLKKKTTSEFRKNTP